MATAEEVYLRVDVTEESIDKLKELNKRLWKRVHTLELKIQTETSRKKKDQQVFQKRLVRLAKHLDLKGYNPAKLEKMLVSQQGEPSLSDSSQDEELIADKGLLGKRRRKQGVDTDSDSDFDGITKVHTNSKLPGKSMLEEYLSFGELAGKIPESLLVNVDFAKFSKANGFETLGEGINALNSDKVQKKPVQDNDGEDK